MSKIKYLGQIIEAKGWRPDPQRSSTIQNMSAPTNIGELQAFLGLAKIFQVYTNDMHDLCAQVN